MTRPVPELNAVRVSTNYFNTYGEIEKLIKALDGLSAHHPYLRRRSLRGLSDLRRRVE